MKQILRFVHLRNIVQVAPICQVWRAAFGSSSHRCYLSDADRPRHRFVIDRKEKHSSSQPMGWMITMHKELMKDVDIPPVRRGATSYSEQYLHELSTEDLMSQARAIHKVDKNTMKVIQALWRRFDSMTVEEMITTADVFFMNGLHAPWYTSALISYMTEMFHLLSISPSQFTRLTLHIANLRNVSPYLMMALEQHLCDRFDEFNMDQVCIIGHAFFLNKFRLKSVFLDKVATKLLSDFSSVKRKHLPMLMKHFRFSNYMKVSVFKELGDLVVKHDYFSKSRSLGDVIHFAFTFASLRVTHDEMFLYMLEQCLNPRFNRRLKDITKIIWACGTLVTNSDRHLIAIRQLIQDTHFSLDVVMQYPDNLAECLLGLAYVNIYPKNLLNKLFNPAVVKILIGFDYQRTKSMQLEFLDHSLAIECPDYAGHQLTSWDREVVKQQAEQYLNVDMDAQYRKGVQPVLTALQSALGADKVLYTNVLPHIKVADILLTYDEERKEFLDFPDNYIITDYSSSLQQDKPLLRIVIILLSKAQFTYDMRPLGLLHCKLRQLNCLNYKTVLVDPDDALNFTIMDEEDIQKFLLPRIFSLIMNQNT